MAWQIIGKRQKKRT